MTRFPLFLMTSAAAAVVNLAVRWSFNLVVPFEVAVVLAFPFGVVSAYVLARTLVFERSEMPLGTQLTRFLVVNLISLVIVWVVSVGLARVVFPAMNITWHAEDLAHLLGLASPAVFAYVAHQRYSFQRK